jgi:tRNA(Glu) U13 pseudouridine synthase TruD
MILLFEKNKPLIKGKTQMDHVRVITVTGHEVEIPHEEALRISKKVLPEQGLDAFHEEVKKRNLHYLKKARRNIREIAAGMGFTELQDDEQEYKNLLSCVLNEETSLGDLIVEIVEERIANHHAEIYSE